ncbi:dienelactone hydrolase family protein [Sorangium sp. So ce1153]
MGRPPQPGSAASTWVGRLNLGRPPQPGSAASTWVGRLNLGRPPQPGSAASTWVGRLNLGRPPQPGSGRAVHELQDALRAASAAGSAPGAARSEIRVYPEVPHAFYADYRPSYRPEAAADAWQRQLDWLAQHGVA